MYFHKILILQNECFNMLHVLEYNSFFYLWLFFLFWKKVITLIENVCLCMFLNGEYPIHVFKWNWQCPLPASVVNFFPYQYLSINNQLVSYPYNPTFFWKCIFPSYPLLGRQLHKIHTCIENLNKYLFSVLPYFMKL